MAKLKDNKVYIAALLYSTITGFSFLFTKIALKSADPIDILAYRFTASFIAILIPTLFKWIDLSYDRKKIIRIMPLALFYPIMFFGFQTFGLQYASSSEGGILLASSPIFVMILASYFLKEKTNIWQKLSIMLSVSGVVYITVMAGASLRLTSLRGIILLVLSALALSGYSIMARILSRDFNSLELSYIMLIMGFVCFNIMAIVKNIAQGTMMNFIAPLCNIDFVLAILYLGVLSSLVTSLLTNYILSKIEASKMSVFSNLGTVISIFAGVIFLNENIFYFHIIGSIFIICGVFGANFLDEKI